MLNTVMFVPRFSQKWVTSSLQAPFVCLRYALQVDDNSMLKSCYFAEDYLKAILALNIDSSYIQKIEKYRRMQQSLKEN